MFVARATFCITTYTFCLYQTARRSITSSKATNSAYLLGKLTHTYIHRTYQIGPRSLRILSPKITWQYSNSVMIPPSTVQLTRVHFYDPSRNERNIEIPSISREVFRYDLDKNRVIKKNIFGHKWVLKINENQDVKKKKCSGKVIVYVWVFCCIIIAICFGIYFSIESKYFPTTNENTTSSMLPNETTEKSLEIPNFELIEDEHERNVRRLIIINGQPESVEETDNENTDGVQDITETLPDRKPDYYFTTSQNSLLCNDCIRNEEICLKTEEFHAPICAKIRDRRDPSGCGGLCELNTQHCKRLHSKMEVFQCVKNKNILRCPPDGFSCGNMCILRIHRCDGIVHCSNMADEKYCVCDMTSYFHCGNGTSCIEKTRKCNGIIDCWDKSDEIDCHRECKADEEPCSNGECIKKEYFCDGIYHCSDHSDEPQGCYISK